MMPTNTTRRAAMKLVGGALAFTPAAAATSSPKITPPRTKQMPPTDQGLLDHRPMAPDSADTAPIFRQDSERAIARSARDKVNEIVSVKDFGAKGDGITDDTAAIQAAADFCQEKGKELFFPSGNYIISNTITLTQISARFEEAGTSKVTAKGSFTAFKIIAARKHFRNFDIWFTPPVNSKAIGVQFGEHSKQFARNIVHNFYVRYAYKSFYNSSDMWGNSFSQINSDFSLNYGYDFNAIPSGTTNSFRNIYSTNAKTTGSISSGSNLLTVANATNLSAGLSIVILGAGRSGPLITRIASVSGKNLTLESRAHSSVDNVPVMLSATAFSTNNFSDTHLFNAYFDGYPSQANDNDACVILSDNFAFVSSIRFEGCALVARNTAFFETRSTASDIGTLMSFATLVDVGAGSYGFIGRFGVGAFSQNSIRDVLMIGFIHYSGGAKKLRVNASDNLTILGRSVTLTDCDSNGFDGCLFFAAQGGSGNGEAPTTGCWDTGDVYFARSPTANEKTGGVCRTPGTFGVLTSTTANTVSGSNRITLGSLGQLRRNHFISIAGIGGVFKVIDIQTGSVTTALVVPAPDTSVSGAAVTFAVPTFENLGQKCKAAGEISAAADIASAASTINTVDKFAGKQVFDTTNHRLMIADGSTAKAPWFVADGSANVVPS